MNDDNSFNNVNLPFYNNENKSMNNMKFILPSNSINIFKELKDLNNNNNNDSTINENDSFIHQNCSEANLTNKSQNLNTKMNIINQQLSNMQLNYNNYTNRYNKNNENMLKSLLELKNNNINNKRNSDFEKIHQIPNSASYTVFNTFHNNNNDNSSYYNNVKTQINNNNDSNDEIENNYENTDNKNIDNNNENYINNNNNENINDNEESINNSNTNNKEEDLLFCFAQDINNLKESLNKKELYIKQINAELNKLKEENKNLKNIIYDLNQQLSCSKKKHQLLLIVRQHNISFISNKNNNNDNGFNTINVNDYYPNFNINSNNNTFQLLSRNFEKTILNNNSSYGTNLLNINNNSTNKIDCNLSNSNNKSYLKKKINTSKSESKINTLTKNELNNTINSNIMNENSNLTCRNNSIINQFMINLNKSKQISNNNSINNTFCNYSNNNQPKETRKNLSSHSNEKNIYNDDTFEEIDINKPFDINNNSSILNSTLQKENDIININTLNNITNTICNEDKSTNENLKQVYKLNFKMKKIISFDISTSSFEEISYNNKDDNFNKKFYINGTSYLNDKNDLYILTGSDHNLLFNFNKLTNEINQLANTYNSHNKGQMIKYDSLVTSRIILISGKDTDSVEQFYIKNNKWIKMPSVNHCRSDCSCLILNKSVLYIFFGYDYKNHKYLDNIEYLDVSTNHNLNKKWSEICINLYIKSFIAFSINNDFYIFGGVYDNFKNNNELIFIDIDKKIASNNIQLHFNEDNKINNKHFKFSESFIEYSDQEPYLKYVYDDKGNMHFFNLKEMSHKLFIDN